jgi:tripeptide aminopeptidase
VRRASESQRQQLHESFAAICRIESPSGNERACADWVSHELRELDLEVEEDDAGRAAGSNCGNLLARISGGRFQSILLCAHLDTVPPTEPIDPVFEDGGWVNANPGILGADNKAAVAVLLELARVLRATPGQPSAGVELLFTVSEENGLRGARTFDVGSIHSEYGYVFDHASPIGEMVLASPTYTKITSTLTGRSAHAGIRPEDGRSAIKAAAQAIFEMKLGRLDAETTANVGTISGGTAANVVPDRCVVEGEARSLRDQRLEQVVTEMVDHFQDAADAAECDLDLTVERMFKGYRTRPSSPAVRLAERALHSCGYEPRGIETGGGSDANALLANGFQCVNLANGTERNHEPGERVSADALDGMLEVALSLLAEAGRPG